MSARGALSQSFSSKKEPSRGPNAFSVETDQIIGPDHSGTDFSNQQKSVKDRTNYGSVVRTSLARFI